MSQATSRKHGWALRRPPILAAVLALAIAPAVARAETPITTQAQADDGAFLAYTPPPAQRAGLCLVDTGVNLNPDTENTVVERTAIDGGGGNDASPGLHGTVLAMMAAAPTNNWGTIGTAPSAIQIVSVRILSPGQTTFPFSSYASGLRACLQMRARFNIRVINLSLGTSEVPSSESYETVRSAIETALHYEIAVTAAAGNDDGGAVGYPAAVPGVLSVGASDSLSGSFCSFSNRGSGLRMLAPGCDLDGADPTTGTATFNYSQGTSEASAIDSAALTALIAYQPDLTTEAAELDLAAAHDGSLDVAQAFRNAGLKQIIAAGEAAEPRPTASDTGAAPASLPQSVPLSTPALMTPTTDAQFSAPRVRLSRRNGQLVLVLAGAPSGARMEARCLGYRKHSHKLVVLRTITTGARTLRLLATGVRELTLRYTDPYDIQRSSPWTTLRPPAQQATHRP